MLDVKCINLNFTVKQMPRKLDRYTSVQSKLKVDLFAIKTKKYRSVLVSFFNLEKNTQKDRF